MVDKGRYFRAIAALMQPGARLVVTHDRKSIFGRLYCITPRGDRISEELAQAILQRSDMQPLDAGLFPGCSQSWVLERRR